MLSLLKNYKVVLGAGFAVICLIMFLYIKHLKGNIEELEVDLNTFKANYALCKEEFKELEILKANIEKINELNIEYFKENIKILDKYEKNKKEIEVNPSLDFKSFFDKLKIEVEK